MIQIQDLNLQGLAPLAPLSVILESCPISERAVETVTSSRQQIAEILHGNIAPAIDSIRASAHSHSFLGIDQDGRSCIRKTTGNHYGHVVLRGGEQGSNYDGVTLWQTANKLAEAGLLQSIIVDCSHDNSRKVATNQETACKAVIRQRKLGYDMIVGIMIESNICDGKQKLPADPSSLKYGVSITDDCLGWERTEALLRWTYSEM